MEKKPKFTPAALGALAKGDVENFMVASTPGGIEAQEARGQKDFVASETLPKEMLGDCTREKLEQMGIVFGEDVDDLFVSCTLPTGWKKVPTDHSMHSKLVDEKGRERAGIFYKAAFYDRRADVGLTRRFQAQCVPEDRYDSDMSHEDRREGMWYGVVTDCGKEIHVTKGIKAASWKQEEILRGKAKLWLDNNYPGWEDPLAWWD